MSSETSIEQSPTLGFLLISSFWFLLGSVCLVVTMTFLHYNAFLFPLGLLASLGFIFIGWGILLQKAVAIAVGALFSLFFGALTIPIAFAGASMMTYSDQNILLGIGLIFLPILFISMALFLVLRGTVLKTKDNLFYSP